MLVPQFDAIPLELRKLNRWVVWKGAKVPYCATALNSKASVNDPSTWSTFEQAKTAFDEGGYLGFGFVLNGDGVAGIDLDKCVHEGRPQPEALDAMHLAGCRYIEISPSGTGLRGFGYAPTRKGRRGRINNVACELYTRGRFLSVTGHVIEDGPLAPLDFAVLAERMVKPPPTEEGQRMTDVILCPPLCSYVTPLSSSVGIPAHTLPKTEGERNSRLFELARWAKGTMPYATREELRYIVWEWHQQAFPVIVTKPFAASWADFQRGWEAVKHPYGATLASIVKELPPLTIDIRELGYGESETRLIRICQALAMHHAPEPFFLSVRQAGDLMELHFTDAAKVLNALCTDGVLEVVTKGAGNRASRYRFTWSHLQTARATHSQDHPWSEKD